MNKLFLITNILIFYLFLAPTGALEEECVCVCVIMLRMTLNEFLKHSK